jgi:hypothetical protein
MSISVAASSVSSHPPVPFYDGSAVGMEDRGPAGGYAIWCLPEASMIVQASGKRRFVRAVLDGLEIRNVRRPA